MIKDIPEQKIKSDKGFEPIEELVTAIKEYYRREHGQSLNSNQIEKQVVRILRSRT